MANVITIMNMKGGVGKTTVAMHLGGTLANGLFSKRLKVLLIDYDPQYNLSQAFIPSNIHLEDLEKKRKTSLAILLDDETKIKNPFALQLDGNLEPPKVDELTYRIYSHAEGGKLDIIASTLDLMYVALGQTLDRAEPVEERFRKFIQLCRECYDIILIDCHPAGSILTKTSLQNSDEVIIPVVHEPYARRGVGLMTKFIEACRTGSGMPRYHILFNKAPRNKATATEAEIRTHSYYTSHCFAATMKQYKSFSTPREGHGFIWKKTGRDSYKREALKNLEVIAGELVGKLRNPVEL